ncbi:heme biosynthesis HemY N-terminal domain-containing protein [Xanthobacter sp. V0B-10]|uniref:heme biosynthesis protein HemY n=1 Tax=Xanthobacter albus TaxID=3119929 RepID=UPI00372A6F6A
MTRLVLILVILAALAFGASWIADRPGEISVVWQGWRVETTVPVALAAVAVVTGVMLAIWRLLALLIASPKLLAALSRRKRRDQGLKAVSRGLLAIGSGDAATARKARAEAARLLPHEPLTHLLTAQAAQFDNDPEAAIAAFTAMAARPETRLLGLRGLHMEARKAGDRAAAATIAAEAVADAPTLGWAADAVIEAHCAAGDYRAARTVLERQMAQKGIDKAQYRRRRAVLLTAEALALEHSDPLVARELAQEAVRLAPTLVPAAACAGRLMGAAGELKKAAKIVETAYAANPHPELAEVEAHLRPGDAALDRLRRVRMLAGKAPGHVESAIALARAALDAHEYDEARRTLEPLLEAPTQRVCLLMAELEAAENGDVGKAREWTARAVHADRDPAWIADGVVSDHWRPISPVTGRLDAFTWAVPPGVSAAPILEHGAERVMAAIAAVRAGEQAKALAEAAARAAESEALHVAAPVADPVGATDGPDAGRPSDEDHPADKSAADVHTEDRPAEPAVGEAEAQPRRRAAAPIVAMPPLPDDPGPGSEEPEPPAPKRRFFGI